MLSERVSGYSFGETATPIKYKTLITDPYLKDVLDYKLRSLEVNSMGPAEIAINEVSVLARDLEDEIQRRR